MSWKYYHIYKAIWMAAIGEVLDCRREPSNPEDRYAIAVIKNETITGHLSRKVRFSLKKLLPRAWRVNPWGLGVHL